MRSIQRIPLLSLRDLAKKFGTSKSNVFKIKKRFNLKTYKKVKNAKRTVEQENRSFLTARKLYSEIVTKNNHCFLMGDETYVKEDFRQLLGQNYYTKKVGSHIDNKFTSVFVDKFGTKFMVWQAICTCGLRTPA